MLKKAYTPLSLLAQSIFLFVVGIILFDQPEFSQKVLNSSLNIILAILTLTSLLRWLFSQNRQKAESQDLLFKVVFMLFLLWKPNTISVSISIIYGFWIAINSFSKFLSFVQLRRLKERGSFFKLIQGIVYLVFAFSLVTSPTNGIVSLTELLGLYCLARAFFAFSDFVRELLGTDLKGKRLRQRIRVKPPVLITAILPMAWLKTLDDPNEKEEIAKWTRKKTVLKDAKPNLEIFLHLSKNTAFGFGHVDIALEDKVYSFGCYDTSSNRFFGMLSDGVLVVADKEPYIPFCLENEKKRLISYKIILKDKQVEAMKKKIDNFLKDSVEWIPDETAPTQQDFARICKARFFKIKHGTFQTYNTLTTNCVAVANIFSGSGGVDLMNPQGIITPGTYSEFLDRQFRRPKSIVVARKVYR